MLESGKSPSMVSWSPFIASSIMKDLVFSRWCPSIVHTGLDVIQLYYRYEFVVLEMYFFFFIICRLAISVTIPM
jgi:hypothetical protein